ncbi:MAG TPA: dTDP-4-dehydrorhamnose reductase [Pirellulales bacterium]
MKIVVTGSGGQLGAALCRRFGPRAIGLDHATLNIADRDAVQTAVDALRPDVVVNAAGFTAVDRAESDRQACQAVNADAVDYLAEACAKQDALLVQISTDYVFGGDASRSLPYDELDEPAPQGVYGQSKLAGEQQAAGCPRHLIVRTCGLYGRRRPGSRSTNFVDAMLRLGAERDVVRVVDDQRCTPTYVEDLVGAIEFLIGSSAEGIYHVVNHGSATWYEFAAEIFRHRSIGTRLERITTAEYAAAAPRPAYSVLDTSKYHALGHLPMPDWHVALGRHLADRQS